MSWDLVCFWGAVGVLGVCEGVDFGLFWVYFGLLLVLSGFMLQC